MVGIHTGHGGGPALRAAAGAAGGAVREGRGRGGPRGGGAGIAFMEGWRGWMRVDDEQAIPFSCHARRHLPPVDTTHAITKQNKTNPQHSNRSARRSARIWTRFACATGWASCRRASTAASSRTWARLRRRLRRRPCSVVWGFGDDLLVVDK